ASPAFEHQAVAGVDGEAGFLGLDRARVGVAGMEEVAVRGAVFAAEDAAGAVHDAVAGGVGEAGGFGLDDHLDDPARPAAIAPVAARIGAELVGLEEQRKAHFGHFEAAELDPARRLPLAAARPAVAGRRGPAAGPGLEEMPDERSVSPRVLALDRDAETAAPSGHRALRTGGGERLDDRLDDLLAAMVGCERHRRAGPSPDHGALLGDDLDRAEGAV